MKNKIRLLFTRPLMVAFIAALGLIIIGTGCRKRSPNGKLDGQWQVQTVEVRATSEVTEPYPKLYYAMNLHVVSLRGSTSATGNMHYSKDEGEVTMDFPYLGDKVEGPSKPLAPYGIYRNPVTFRVLKLTGSQLVLESEESVVTMRRF